MAKALIGIFRALKRQDLYERKKRVRSLPNIEALRKPSRMISDVHAIKREHSQLSVYRLVFRNFSGFYVHRITANAVIFYPQKSHRPSTEVCASDWLQRYELVWRKQRKLSLFFHYITKKL